MSRIVRFLALVAGLALFLPALGVIVEGATPAGAAPKVAAKVTLRNIEKAPRLPTGARSMGAMSPSATVSGAVVLEPRDPSSLANFIAEATDRDSSSFHHYLAPGAFATTFGPTKSTVAAVEKKLRAGGLEISNVASDHLVVSFRGAASKVESTFHTGIERYRLAGGDTGFAATKAVKLPSSISGSVVGVVGLDDLVKAQQAGPIVPTRKTRASYPKASAPAVTPPPGSADACTTAVAAALDGGGLTDEEIADAYGTLPLYQKGDFGKGQTIAVYELGAFNRTNLTTVFDPCYFGATKATSMEALLHTETNTPTLKIDGGQPAGNTAESALDVDDVSAIAPTATIDVYQAPNNTFGGLDEYSAIVNQDKAKIVTSSWGLCEQAVEEGEPGVQQAENVLFEQAAAQGQSVFAAAGDTGSDNCNAFRTPTPVTPVLSVDDPASQPYVIGVGGLTMTDATQPPTEHVWNDGPLWGAGGGGISASWPMPSWQEDSHVPGINTETALTVVRDAEEFMNSGFCLTTTTSSTARCREVPDVSAQADEFTGSITFYTPTLFDTRTFTGWYTIGGTSSATPIWAALTALVAASTTEGSGSVCGKTGSDLGFVSPLLYTIASNPTAYAASFTSISVGNNDPYGYSLLYPAKQGTTDVNGYNMAAGLGSPNLTDATGTEAGLAYYLCRAATSTSTPRPAVTGLTPTFASTTTAGPAVTISGSGFCTGPTIEVEDVQVGTMQVTHGTTVRPVTCTSTPQTIKLKLPPAAELTPPGDTTDGAGAYQVIVTLASGASSAPGTASTFEYVDEAEVTGAETVVPTVTSVRSYAGSETGGNSIEIFGTGFTGASSVTVGGRTATSFTVTSDYEITAVVPAYEATVTSCAQHGDPTLTDTATNDICQTTVVVHDTDGESSSGGSATGCEGPGRTIVTILPYYEGLLTITPIGIYTPVKGTQEAPLPCEYDYLPNPKVTSVTTTPKVHSKMVSELGGTLVTITGSGFNDAGLDWVSIGTPKQAISQDFTIVSATGTTIELAARALPKATYTIDPNPLELSVTTAAGTSTTTQVVTYSGFPSTPTSVVNATTTSNLTRLDGKSAAPDTGGTLILIKGPFGYTDTTFVLFANGFNTVGTQYNVIPASTEIETLTPSANPGIVNVEVCTVTACSRPTIPELTTRTVTTKTTPTKTRTTFPTQTQTRTKTTDLFALFAPGNPVISSVKPTEGNAGTLVAITGQNLGCVLTVKFGTTPATTFANLTKFTLCGTSTTAVVVKAPPHAAGTVTVHVTTLESTALTVPTTSDVTFTYESSSSITPPSTGVTTPTTPSAPTPPAAPPGSTTVKTGSSSTASGKATVTDPGAGVKATGSGFGSFTVAKYTGNPTSSTLSISTGKYVDLEIATGSDFTSLTVTVCSPTATGLDWWNGSVWLPFSDQTTTSTGCVTATVTATTSPTLAQLTGTPLTTVKKGVSATRIAGQTADATAVKELETEFPATGATRSCVGGKAGSANTRPVVLATTKTFPDALAASYLASSLDTGVLLTPSTALSTVTAAALKKEGVTKVVIVGGTLAVSATVAKAIAATPASSCGGGSTLAQDITVTRIGGETAEDTAEDIAVSVPKTDVGSASFTGAYAGVNATSGDGAYNDTAGSGSAAPSSSEPLRTAILANGNEYQDAMSASAIAYALKLPVLLTTATSLSSQASSGISQLAITQVIVMGGQLAITDTVVSALEKDGLSVLRVGGKDATDTAAELAKFEVAGSGAGLGWTEKVSAAVARGNGFTDGLAGSVVTGKTKLPLLLTENPTTVGTYLTAFLKSAGQSGTGIDGKATSKLKALAILGGPLAISTAVVSQMETDLS